LTAGNRVQKPIANDQDPDLAPQIFSDSLRVAVRHAEKGASCYASVPGGPLLSNFIEAFNKSGFSFKSLLVWKKNQFVLGRSDYQFIHENILYGWIESSCHYFVDDRTQTSVFEIDKPHISREHPTCKPLGLIQLADIRYEIDSRGRMRIESKQKARGRRRASPDRAEALMLAIGKPREQTLWLDQGLAGMYHHQGRSAEAIADELEATPEELNSWIREAAEREAARIVPDLNLTVPVVIRSST
jgi:hypothetical protein